MSHRRAILGLASAALVVTLLGGCTAFYWSKAGATPEQFISDSQECAKDAAPTPTASYGVMSQDVYRGCLQKRGYLRSKQYQPVPPGYFRGIE
jgi:hypothetical protein